MDTHCIFCRIVAGQIPASKILETEDVLAFLDINPIEKGHVLVIPKAHCATLLDASDAVASATIRGVRRIAAAMVKGGAGGVNVLQSNFECAGQVVPHLHFHVIPRTGTSRARTWESGAGAYSSPEERDRTAQRLRAAVDGLPGDVP